MTTLHSREVPDGLACRLAAYYAQSCTNPLAVLYWTGQVLPGAAAGVRLKAKHVHLGHTRGGQDSRGSIDQNAILAELRALACYCETHEGRPAVEGWLDRDAQWFEDYNLVVPWAWRGELEV